MCGAQTNCVPGVAERVILWLAAELSFGGSPRADAPPGFPRQPVDSQTRRQDAGDQCGRRPQPRPSTVSIPALPERDSVDPRLGRVVRPLRVRSVSRPAVRPNDNTKPISAPGLCPRQRRCSTVDASIPWVTPPSRPAVAARRVDAIARPRGLKRPQSQRPALRVRTPTASLRTRRSRRPLRIVPTR